MGYVLLIKTCLQNKRPWMKIQVIRWLIIDYGTINISLETCANIFVFCEGYDYSKADNLDILKHSKYYCENKLILPMDAKLKIDEKNPYYSNFDKFLLSPQNTLKSAKDYNNFLKQEKIIKDTMEKKFMSVYQLLLKNYETISQVSIFFQKYIIFLI